MKKNKKKSEDFIFEKKNFQVMLVGIIFIVVGFVLMSGGGSDDPNVFNPEIYNFRRIRLAPTLVLIGFAIQVFAILTSSTKK